MIPYTYLIGWSVLGLFYYGVRYGIGCHPSDLFVTYFTSSKKVRDLRLEHGEPDVIQVRQCFESREAASQWEHKVLRRLKVLKHQKMLNITSGKHAAILHHTEETRQKISAAALKNSDKIKARMSALHTGKTISTKQRAAIAHSNRTRVLSEETRAKLSAAKRNMSPETRAKIAASKIGKSLSLETRAKIAASKRLGVRSP